MDVAGVEVDIVSNVQLALDLELTAILDQHARLQGIHGAVLAEFHGVVVTELEGLRLLASQDLAAHIDAVGTEFRRQDVGDEIAFLDDEQTGLLTVVDGFVRDRLRLGLSRRLGLLKILIVHPGAEERRSPQGGDFRLEANASTDSMHRRQPLGEDHFEILASIRLEGLHKTFDRRHHLGGDRHVALLQGGADLRRRVHGRIEVRPDHHRGGHAVRSEDHAQAFVFWWGCHERPSYPVAAIAASMRWAKRSGVKGLMM